MTSLRKVVLVVSSLVSFAAAANLMTLDKRQLSFTPGTLNNTQEFYVTLRIEESCVMSKYNGWHLEAYHTGAGLADPVFVSPNSTDSSSDGSRAYLNSTNLQFDVSPYAFSANGSPGDTNYARWEPVTIASSFGSGGFEDQGDENGIVQTNEEFDGWLVCEWFHGANLPQLFQLIKGFDGIADSGEEPGSFPCNCERATLFATFL